MRYSKQREMILRAVMGSKLHPTAAEVYETVHRDDPHISLGTVYRNLNQLTEAGRIKKLQLPDGSNRFDGTTAPHSHVVCARCGRVFDTVLPVERMLMPMLETAPDFRVTGFELILYGVCAECQRREHTVSNSGGSDDATQGQ